MTVLLLIIAVLGVLIMFPPAAPPPPTAEQQQEARAHFEAIRVERRLAKKDAVVGKPHPTSEVATEQDLNTYLATDELARVQLSKKGVEQAFVRVGNGTIQATATREVHGVPVSVTAAIRPIVTKDGRLVATLEGLDVGRLGIPASVAQGAAREMVEALTAKLADPELKYKSVTVRKGSVTLSYDTR